MFLFHTTTKEFYESILESGYIKPSTDTLKINLNPYDEKDENNSSYFPYKYLPYTFVFPITILQNTPF